MPSFHGDGGMEPRLTLGAPHRITDSDEYQSTEKIHAEPPERFGGKTECKSRLEEEPIRGEITDNDGKQGWSWASVPDCYSHEPKNRGQREVRSQYGIKEPTYEHGAGRA
jgi:hypothetical protein